MQSLTLSLKNRNLQLSRRAVKTLAGALCNPVNVEKVGVLNALAVRHAQYTWTLQPDLSRNKVEYISTRGADIYFRIEDGPTVVVDAYAF